ncbi:MAG: glycosyltransferase family 2 protein [Candidatus Aenigmatarchaeota archaeon]
MKVAVLLPTLNEEESIGEVLEGIPETEGYEVDPVVVDGLSTDGTVEIAREKGARVLLVPERGKGIAFRAAVKHLLDEYDRFVMLDADTTYPPEYIPEFLEELEEHDFVRGARNLRRENMHLTHIIGNTLTSFITSLLFQPTRDLCTGYLGFTREALEKMELRARGFDLEADIFAKASRKGLDIEEIEVEYRHRKGESNLDPVPDSFRIILRLVREALRI